MVRLSIPIAIPLALAACGGAQEAPQGPRLAIEVAPLELAGIDDACYTLTVFADPASTGDVVWSEARVCADRYGDRRGSISYVGPCDASGDGQNLVRLVVEDLCSGGPCAATTPGPTSLPADAWRNPCPAPEGCTQVARAWSGALW